MKLRSFGAMKELFPREVLSEMVEEAKADRREKMRKGNGTSQMYAVDNGSYCCVATADGYIRFYELN